MLKIQVLKVENPSCLWGRVIWGQEGESETTEQYNNLLSQINLFYNDVTQDLRKLKPKRLEAGQVCAVYWSVKKLWCRAKVESVVMDSVSSNVRCLLVDHGERLIVPSNQVRVVIEKFLQLPFWVRRFHLARVQPTTLQVSICEEKAALIPSTWWDSSATLYLHNLLQASIQAEAVLLESNCESTSIELYLTVGNVKICVNDDLVAKTFAHYSRESADISKLDKEDSFPLMSLPSILTQAVSTASNKPTAQSQPPPVILQDQAALGAGDRLTAPFTPQSQQHELENSKEDRRLKIPKEQLSPHYRSKNRSDAAVARFLKFMNPDTSYHQAVPTVRQHEELNNSQPEETNAGSSTCTPQELYTACTTSQIPISSRSAESGQEVAEMTWRTEESQACSRLLEWLNPAPLDTNQDTLDDTVVPDDPRKSGILAHSALPVEPCTSLDDAPITDALRSVLRRKEYIALSPADHYSWPAVARGCNTIVISHKADQPLTYLGPFLTHILLNSIFSSLNSSTGPIAVLLCPSWEKAQVVYDLLEEFKVSQILHPLIVLLGVGKDEAKTTKIPQNCLLLVTTPFILVRLLSCHCFMFLRLYHLVLDEADQLFSLAPDQMECVLQHFKKVNSHEEKALCPQQTVAVAKRWTSHMECLLANHMLYPCIVMTVPEEAALYGNVQQIILMTPESSKISVLLGALDFNPDVGQKTLIVANSGQEVENVFKAVSSKSAFCLKTHEGLTHQFDFVIQQWRKDISPGTQVILVTTNDCLKCLGIRDATCVFHYGFPCSPKLFGSRLFCMAENFRNLSERDQIENCPRLAKSVLLFSERNVHHVVGVMRYLGRTNTPLPPELLSFAQEILVAREDQKTNKPLCRYLKSFGVCRDSSVCTERHRFISQLDQSQLPSSGVIEVVPLYIKTASVFYGRVVRKGECDFDSLVSEMALYYGNKKPRSKEILKGGLYAVQEGNTFHRVKIVSLPDKQDHLFYRIFVQFIDIGKEEEVKSHQILQLPEQFHCLPGQAVEIIVCQVKPVDAEIDWHPKATRAISRKIRGLQHLARAVLSLGNTVFVDPMVRVTHLPGLKRVINEHNVQSEILNTGMGVSNPDHLDLLRALCQECEATDVSGSRDGLASLEVRIKAEEAVLAESFRATEVRTLTAPPHLEPCEPVSPASTINHSLIPESPASNQLDAQNTYTSDLKSADQVKRNKEELMALLNPCQHGLLAGEDQTMSQQVIITTNGTDNNETSKSFHPQVRWYQTSVSVVVTVKLMNPESQCCDFYPDRIVYRGRVNGRTYAADLDLQGGIIADCCCWEMKSNEPVLRLIKQKQGHWEKLVRNKNIFVSYDMQHFEEDEDIALCDRWFVADTGEDNWYVNSECSSDTD